MTLVIDTNDGLDGVITLDAAISGKWKLVHSMVSDYAPKAINSSNNELIINTGSDISITLPNQDILDPEELRTTINTALGDSYVTATDLETPTLTFTGVTNCTIKWSESSASVLFTNSGADRDVEIGEYIALKLRDRSRISHYKIYIDESWKNNVTTSGEKPTFVVPSETLVEIPEQTMEIPGNTTTLTISIREYGNDNSLDPDIGPELTLVLNQV